MKPVKYQYAVLHQQIHLPGLKVYLNKTVDSQHYPGIEMVREYDGVWIQWKGKTFTIPYVNFSILSHDPVQEADPVPDKASKKSKEKDA